MIRSDFTRGEAVMGLIWLSLAALTSLVLEVVYLGARLPLPGDGSIAFPITILIAGWFNWVLTRTAKLWTTHMAVACIPLAVWLLGYFLLLLGVEITGDQMLANNIRSVLLLFAGVAGGVWPFFRAK
ncbi:hypothetical protein [Corynebacterium camporealensis]|uniref:Uncharacterized protein n=1 Tax=Corynebacterium camporealensis TaxID=161896 RepID=A0A0F6QWC5_9CORY|nr:hypothetical protein [Corynebacterium camporealensis]AKE38870.1 hypothetical protein UL81_04485 [Corynebacterium camporealensis]